jgi:hypothetical protein
MLWLPGPNQTYDIKPGPELDAALTHLWKKNMTTPWLADRIFDPTNGSNFGDIVRWKR